MVRRDGLLIEQWGAPIVVAHHENDMVRIALKITQARQIDPTCPHLLSMQCVGGRPVAGHHSSRGIRWAARLDITAKRADVFHESAA